MSGIQPSMAVNVNNFHHLGNKSKVVTQAQQSNTSVSEELVEQLKSCAAKTLEGAQKMNRLLESSSGNNDAIKEAAREQKAQMDQAKEMLRSVAPDLSNHLDEFANELSGANNKQEINDAANRAVNNIGMSPTYQDSLGQPSYLGNDYNNSSNDFGSSLEQLLGQLGDAGGTGCKTNTLVLAIAVCLALASIGADVVDSYTNMIAENGAQVKQLNNVLNAFVGLQKELPCTVTLSSGGSSITITSVRQLFEYAYGGGKYADATPSPASMKAALGPLTQLLSSYQFSNGNPPVSTTPPPTGSIMTYLESGNFSNAATTANPPGLGAGNATLAMNYVMQKFFASINSALSHMGSTAITPDISTISSPAAGGAGNGSYQFVSGDISQITSTLQGGIATGGNTSQSLGVELETQQTNYTKCVGLAKSIEGMFSGLADTVASIN